jgi:GNAT superfamily N-acetyltransferase
VGILYYLIVKIVILRIIKILKKIRPIKFDELEQLLDLYQHLNKDDPRLEMSTSLQQLWQEIFDDPNLYYLVIEEDGILVSSCTFALIKNLTRNARPYVLIENVVTHAKYRNKGYGTAILQRTVEIAKAKGCYKVMLMTSRKEERTLKFYEKAGFHNGDKTAFVIRILPLR